MWLLKDSNGKISYLKPNKLIKVGRKQADIVLENDSSISRAHATVTVTLKDQVRTSDISSTCIVKDANSKYGTFIIRNNVQIKAACDGTELEPSDTLKFGLQQHVFTVQYIRFVTVISRLSMDHKKQLKNIVDSIGGIITDCYDDNCTHLTATTATTTNKIISALISGIPIVDISYWISVLNAIEANSVLPDPNLFILPLQDKGVNTQRVSLKPNPIRKTLFQGKTFVFFSETMCREYKKMIKDAGGNIELHAISSNNIPEDFLEDNTIVMQITDESITDELATFNTLLYEKMHEKKLRMIAEAEIPLAIVYVSLDQYCNPKYHFKNLMQRKAPKEDTSTILAVDTQDVLTTNSDSNINSASSLKPITIPETSDFMQDETINKYEENGQKNNDQKDNTKLLITKSKPADDNNVDDFMKPSSSMHHDSELNKSIPKEYSANVDLSRNKSELESVKEKGKELDVLITKDNDSGSNSFIKKKTSSMVEESKTVVAESENKKSKKRQREKSPDEIIKTDQTGWKIVEPSVSIKNKKIRDSIIPISRNENFVELEQKKSETKEVKQNKYGFKKSDKKARDFDLDDLDMDTDEVKKESKKITIKSDVNVKKEPHNSSEKMSSIDRLSKFNERDQFDDNFENKSVNIGSMYKNPKENTQDWTSAESSKVKSGYKNNVMIKNENNAPTLIRRNIKLDPDVDVKDWKVFKKVYNPIPVRRIALSDMTVWKPNT